MTDEKILRELNKLVAAKANERYILAKLKTLRYQKIGKDNLKKLIDCFCWKDTYYNELAKVKICKTSMQWYEGQPYETFVEFFSRWLKREKLASIKKAAARHQIIIPNECYVESVGQLDDTSSIVRLKKGSSSVKDDLKNLGVGENYTFVNMKLLLGYYHHVHSPVSGKLKRIMPIEGKSNFFGKNTVWFLEWQTKKKPVYLLLVGESAVQDFNFLVKKNDGVKIADDLGYFVWGSQTVLLFDKNSYREDVLIQKNNHYFLGQPVI